MQDLPLHTQVNLNLAGELEMKRRMQIQVSSRALGSTAEQNSNQNS